MVFSKKKAPEGAHSQTVLTCDQCSEYETSFQSHMTRHRKFWCPNREGQEDEVSDWSLGLVVTTYAGTHWSL